MNDSSIVTTVEGSWVLIIAIVLIILFIFLLIWWFFLESGTTAIIVIVIAIIFLLIAIGLFVYFFFFTRSTTSPGGDGGGGNGGGTGPPPPPPPPPPPTPPPPPSDNFVRFGDTIQVSSNFMQNQFISPCGFVMNSCGVQVSLRSDASFNQNGGTSSGLRSWLITGGTTGSIIAYGSTIRLISQANSQQSCPNCDNNPIAVCQNVGGDPNPFNAAQVVPSNSTSTDTWIILKVSGPAGNNVQYSDVINLRNATFRDPDEGQDTYLSVCQLEGNCNNDISGSGCGRPLFLSTFNNAQAGWIIRR